MLPASRRRHHECPVRADAARLPIDHAIGPTPARGGNANARRRTAFNTLLRPHRRPRRKSCRAAAWFNVRTMGDAGALAKDAFVQAAQASRDLAKNDKTRRFAAEAWARSLEAAEGAWKAVGC